MLLDTGAQLLICHPLGATLVEERSAWLSDVHTGANLRKAHLLQCYDRLSALRGPQPFFEINSFNGVELERLASDDTLHAQVIGFELLESNEVASFKAGVFIAPAADCIRMQPVPSRQLGGRRFTVEFPQDPNDLPFGEAVFFT
ncbi:MAG TPA: hypothetical protein VGF98_10950 [Candidatus Tumulicola sp.]|jgi:hypothetical protein